MRQICGPARSVFGAVAEVLAGLSVRGRAGDGERPDLSVRGLPPFRTRFVEWLKALVFAIFPASLIVRVQNALGSGAKEKCV